MPNGDKEQPEHDEIKYIGTNRANGSGWKKSSPVRTHRFERRWYTNGANSTQSANVNPRDTMGYLDDEQIERLRESVAEF